MLDEFATSPIERVTKSFVEAAAPWLNFDSLRQGKVLTFFWLRSGTPSPFRSPPATADSTAGATPSAPIEKLLLFVIVGVVELRLRLPEEELIEFEDATAKAN